MKDIFAVIIPADDEPKAVSLDSLAQAYSWIKWKRSTTNIKNARVGTFVELTGWANMLPRKKDATKALVAIQAAKKGQL